MTIFAIDIIKMKMIVLLAIIASHFQSIEGKKNHIIEKRKSDRIKKEGKSLVYSNVTNKLKHCSSDDNHSWRYSPNKLHSSLNLVEYNELNTEVFFF